MKKLSLFLTAAVLFIASVASAQNCTSLIVDKAGVVNNPAVIQNAARNLVSQGADVHVVTIPSVAQYGKNLEAVETFIESKCPSWTQNGVRKANLFVVMLAPNDRQKNIFLGSYYNGSFDIGSAYSNASNAFFKNRQWSEGLASVLNATGGTAIAFRRNQFAAQQAQQQARQTYTPPVQQRTYTPTTTYMQPTQQADSGMSGLAIFMIVMFVLVTIAVILYFMMRDSGTVTNTTTYVDRTPDYSAAPSYSSRRYGVAAPSHTTIINNSTPQYDSSGNLITGVLIGEAIAANRNQPPAYYPPTPSYVAPSPVVYDTPVPDPAPVVQDQPDSTWDDQPTQQSAPVADAQDTSWNDPAPTQDYSTPDPTPDFSSNNNDTSF